MPLKMRPTGLGAGIDKDRPDFTVYCGEWEVGRTRHLWITLIILPETFEPLWRRHD
jgi:hypothetical protein